MTGHRRAARVMAADCLCFRARRVSRALTRMYDEALRPVRIQATQLTLLNAVATCGESAAMGRPGDGPDDPLPRPSPAPEALQKAGLARIDPLPADLRDRFDATVAATSANPS